jgi:hypothetical protein
MYVYKQTEEELWTTGFYRPDGAFEPEQDCGSEEEATERVHWLNGGEKPLPIITVTRGPDSFYWDVHSNGKFVCATMHPGRDVVDEVRKLGSRALVTYSDENSMTARRARRVAAQADQS